MKEHKPDALQPWFADDASAAGKAADSAACLGFLVEHGPLYGFFVGDDKSHFICKEEDEPVARSEFERLGLKIKFARGYRYLGGFVGSQATKQEWIK